MPFVVRRARFESHGRREVMTGMKEEMKKLHLVRT
jgi:hypothetical protein